MQALGKETDEINQEQSAEKDIVTVAVMAIYSGICKLLICRSRQCGRPTWRVIIAQVFYLYLSFCASQVYNI